jgi:GntR family transcriptional regulator
MTNIKTLFKIDRRSLISQKDQLLHAFEENIYTQKINHDEHLPLPNELAKAITMPIDDVEKVYATLVHRGVLVFEDGFYKVHYNSMAAHYFDRFIGAYDAIIHMGYQPKISVLESRVVHLTKSKLIAIGFQEDEEIFKLSRIFYAGDNPFALIVAYYPMSIFKNIDKIDFSVGPSGKILESKYGISPQKYSYIMTSENTGSKISTIFNIRPNRSLFHLIAIGKDKTDSMVEYNDTWIFPGAYFSIATSYKS